MRGLINDFAQLIMTSRDTKIPVHAITSFLASLQKCQPFQTHDVGNLVEAFKGLGSFLQHSGFPVIVRAKQSGSGKTTSVNRRQSHLIMESSGTMAKELDPEFLTRKAYSGLNDDDVTASETLEVLITAARNWLKRADPEMQEVSLTDKHAVLMLCPTGVRQAVHKYVRAQKVALGVLGKVIQIVRTRSTDFRMQHVLEMLSAARESPTSHFTNRGFPSWMIEIENLLFVEPNIFMCAMWYLLSPGIPSDCCHLTAVLKVQAKLLA